MNDAFIPLRCENASGSHITLGECVFEQSFLRDLAISSSFYKRAPRKIDICNLLAVICSESVKGSPSYNDLAAAIETNNPNIGPSRQAIHLRMGPAFDAFMCKLLETVIAERFLRDSRKLNSQEDPKTFDGFQRVLVQDSTVIKLPAHFYDEFSGVSNAHTITANSRIQATYELISQKLLGYSIDSYSKNDVLAASELNIKAGDLSLRDRGYLINDEIRRHRDAGADCIYRHKCGTTYLDPDTKEPIDLASKLRKNSYLDINVLLNNPSQTPVRLLSAPVDEETANTRRMKAKRENKGHNPSKKVLEMMSWTILITTISADKADFKKLLAIYGLRWRIEVVFKSWKSHLSFDKLHRVSRNQLFILLKARLLLVTCCTNILYQSLALPVWEIHRSKVSLIKLIKFLSSNSSNMIRAITVLFGEGDIKEFLKVIRKYCCYDHRKRKNYTQSFEDLA